MKPQRFRIRKSTHAGLKELADRFGFTIAEIVRRAFVFGCRVGSDGIPKGEAFTDDESTRIEVGGRLAPICNDIKPDDLLSEYLRQKGDQQPLPPPVIDPAEAATAYFIETETNE